MGVVSLARDAVLVQHALRRRVDRIADLFCGNGRRGDFKPVGDAFAPHHVFHHEFRHRTSADVAVADEQDFYHTSQMLLFYRSLNSLKATDPLSVAMAILRPILRDAQTLPAVSCIERISSTIKANARIAAARAYHFKFFSTLLTSAWVDYSRIKPKMVSSGGVMTPSWYSESSG